MEDVKNPNALYERLNLSDEGKTKLGVTKAQQIIDEFSKTYERNKLDAQTSAQRTAQAYSQQIEDAKQSTKRDLDWMSQMGTSSSVLASSGINKAMENIAADGNKTISRISQTAENASHDNAQYLSRISEDYATKSSTAKKELDDAIVNLKHDMGLQLSALADKYGTGNKTLTNELDKITDQYAKISLENYSKYVSTLKSIDDVTKNRIDMVKQANDLQNSIADKRYNEYLSNNGALLLGTNLKSLSEEVKNGNLSQQRYSDLRNVMVNSVYQTLSKMGKVDQSDIDTANHLLDIGKSPTEIVSALGAQSKFRTSTEKPISVGSGTQLYDPTTGKWITPPATTTT